MDLNLITIARQNGKDQQSIPGLHIASQPRRPARGRRNDRLILYFILEGNAPMSPEGQDQLLAHLAQTFYKTPGSVTAALRAVAETLNQSLLDRNLRAASSGQQGLGLLILLVERDGHLYLAQCGTTHTFLVSSQGLQRFDDPNPTSRGLGISRSTPIYYSQADLKPDDTLILTPRPDPTWSSITLRSLHGKDPGDIRQQLLSQAGADVNAVLVQAKAGSGKSQLLVPVTAAAASASITEATEKKATSQAPEAISPAEPLQETTTSTPEAPAAEPAPIVTAEPLQESAVPPETAPAAQATETQVPAAPPPKTSPRKGALAAAMAGLGAFLGRGLQSIRSFLGRLLPSESILTLPSSVMFFIAVAVPLVVVAVATVVYFQRGRAGQYDTYYAQAVQSAGFARTQTDPIAAQQAWDAVFSYLDQAKDYGITPESLALRAEAQQALDALNNVVRLEYNSAIVGGLPLTANVTRLLPIASDLYILDSSNGNVLRAIDTGQGYEIDTTYQCGPGGPGSQGIGPLIDIIPSTELSDRGVNILGLDSSGNLLQCHPGEPPEFISLAAPSTGWGQPQAFSADQGNLYILDPAANAVWIYWNSDFTQQPQLFFNESVPPMGNTVDLAVENDDLYLLHNDGHMTLCTFSNLEASPTRCTDPAPYSDSRSGREGQVLLPHPAFSQMQTTRPPDPSLYLLDPGSQAIYHFSLRLTYQRQLRPLGNPEATASTEIEPASAFAISPDSRLAFLASGNQVMYAGMP